MNRRMFLEGVAGVTAALAVGAEARAAKRSSFDIRGVYFHDGFDFEPHSHAPLYWDLEAWRRQMRWLKSCGINAVEFATMLEFNRVPSTDMERKKIADRLKILDEVHRMGMRFGYLLTNTVVSTVPEGEEPAHQLRNRAVNLCPRQPGNFEKTLANGRFYMKTYREADFFEEFAADWGGCTCGECGVPEYLKYVRALGDDLSQMNRKATLYANTWCIAFWRKDPTAKGWKEVFDREISGSREVIAALPGLPKNVGIGLPSHHLYRPLTFSEYGGQPKTPAFPKRSDIDSVHGAGRKSLAWPHFVMDDDAFRPKAWGIVHSEVRYIQALLRSLNRAGIDSVMGNLYLPLLQISNTFAYGRLLEDVNAAPEKILGDFARLMVVKEDRAALVDVMAWLENNSSWQQQMPANSRLPNLSISLDRTAAIRAAASLRPNPSPSMPLPMSPETWLADLRRSLARMDWA